MQEEKSLEDQLKAKREQDVQDFKAEYEALIEKYGCRLSPVYTISEQGVVPSLDIILTK